MNQGYYQEQFRPQFHFSPETSWTNDPNGLVFYKGNYHLFYQHNPNNVVWGPMHWGHAMSKDLLHWEHLPIALYPDELGTIFSGSAVIDFNNSSGFAADESVPLIAFYSYSKQYQAIAYSNDGINFEKFNGNPVIGLPEEVKDFRDPKAFWHSKTNKWVSIISQGDHAVLYSSEDFKSWSLLSIFTTDSPMFWECPDLFPLVLQDQTIWIVTVANNQYFVGDFDGVTFEPFDEEYRVLDHGKDNYAAVTFNNIDRRVSIGWMLNWEYANNIPTSTWRGSMTIPRELTLIKLKDDIFVRSFPVSELDGIMTLEMFEPAIEILPNKEYIVAEDFGQSEISFSATCSFQFLFKNDLDERLRLTFDHETLSFTVDRSRSGIVDFNDSFPHNQTLHVFPRLAEAEPYKFYFLLDWSSLEIFIDQGISVMTIRMFPNEPYNMAVIENDPNLPHADELLFIFDFKIRKADSVWEE